jgi:hypothetical protein
MVSRARGKHLVVVAAFRLEAILSIFPEELVTALLNCRLVGGASTGASFVAASAVTGEDFAAGLDDRNINVSGDVAGMGRLGRVLDDAVGSVLWAPRVAAIWPPACLC